MGVFALTLKKFKIRYPIRKKSGEIKHLEEKTMLKKIIVFALVLTLSVGMLSALTFSTSADVLYDGGTGTEADPYVIATEASLKALADAVNGGANQAGVFFKLGADITLTGEWTPIGLFDDSQSIDAPFCGSFNGMGHKIDGLNITSTDKASVGLFGSLGENAVIKNVTVNGTITAHARFLGAVAGITLNNATIQNCVSNVVIDAKTSKAFGDNVRMGGVVGFARGTNVIEYCVNNGKITVTQDADAAAIATKAFVGGVVGDLATGTFKYCYNNADVEIKGVGTSYAAGLISNISAEGAVISDSFAKGNLTATDRVSTGCNGGIVAQFGKAGTVTNCGYAGTIASPSADTFVGYLSGNTKGYPTFTNCKTTGDVLFGGSHASKATATDCTTGVENIDDIELAVKTAISEWVKVELPAAPEQPENPDTADNVIVAVVVAVLSAFGMATVIYFKKSRANAL